MTLKGYRTVPLFEITHKSLQEQIYTNKSKNYVTQNLNLLVETNTTNPRFPRGSSLTLASTITTINSNMLLIVLLKILLLLLLTIVVRKLLKEEPLFLKKICKTQLTLRSFSRKFTAKIIIRQTFSFLRVKLSSFS